MAAEVRVGMIGMGGHMNSHSKALGDIPDAKVVAIVDPIPEHRANHMGRYPHLANVAEYDDARSMLRKEKLDAVVIASPHVFHFEQVMAALDRGCHVLVEKPMVCRIDHGLKVSRKVRQTGLVLTIGYQRHTMGPYRYVRREIAAGAIGKLKAVACYQGQEWLKGTKGKWRQDPAISCGGQLNDSGSHLIDIMLWMTGLQAETVSAQIDQCGTRVDINSAINVRFTSGAVGTVTVFGDSPTWWEDISIVGDKGAFYFRERMGLVQQVGMRDAQYVVDAAALGSASVSLDFIRAIQGKTKPVAPAECGLRVIELTEAAWKSGAAGGKTIRVPRTKL